MLCDVYVLVGSAYRGVLQIAEDRYCDGTRVSWLSASNITCLKSSHYNLQTYLSV